MDMYVDTMNHNRLSKAEAATMIEVLIPSSRLPMMGVRGAVDEIE